MLIIISVSPQLIPECHHFFICWCSFSLLFFLLQISLQNFTLLVLKVLFVYKIYFLSHISDIFVLLVEYVFYDPSSVGGDVIFLYIHFFLNNLFYWISFDISSYIARSVRETSISPLYLSAIMAISFYFLFSTLFYAFVFH